jgi:hypothetical protein
MWCAANRSCTDVQSSWSCGSSSLSNLNLLSVAIVSEVRFKCVSCNLHLKGVPSAELQQATNPPARLARPDKITKWPVLRQVDPWKDLPSSRRRRRRSSKPIEFGPPPTTHHITFLSFGIPYRCRGDRHLGLNARFTGCVL